MKKETFVRGNYIVFGNENMEITCIKCNQTMNQIHFTIHDIFINGIRKLKNICLHCHNEAGKLRKKYKVEYKHLKTEYCACCGVKDKKLVLDHCHVTKKFRDWICQNCNSAIGLVKEKIKVLEKIKQYLLK